MIWRHTKVPHHTATAFPGSKAFPTAGARKVTGDVAGARQVAKVMEVILRNREASSKNRGKTPGEVV